MGTIQFHYSKKEFIFLCYLAFWRRNLSLLLSIGVIYLLAFFFFYSSLSTLLIALSIATLLLIVPVYIPFRMLKIKPKLIEQFTHNYNEDGIEIMSGSEKESISWKKYQKWHENKFYFVLHIDKYFFLSPNAHLTINSLEISEPCSKRIFQ